MKIRVPATSANLGPGFDSIGIAVNCYLTIEVLNESNEWFIEHSLGNIPSDESNLLITTAKRVFPALKPHRIKMISDIPLARGLGSSSSVIVAGIELANQLAKLNLTDNQKFEIANDIEGHPDNVAPAIFGNLVIASPIGQKMLKIIADFPECDLLAYVPHYELKTSESRQVLPKTLSYKEAVLASSTANLLIASLLTGDLKTAGQAMTHDHFHEPYRQTLVPEFEKIKKIAMENNAYAVYLSGAGPTIMILLPQTSNEIIESQLKEHFSGKLLALTIDKEGVFVTK